ncbi:transcription factor VBP-like [Melitaea cinxia]|uniref:transcription factor VBP-like n=1 Tax=Melitaea cinxia TaxID=113334 RepID=UPI001E274975|nr:transcription factor VBP-like [Melitaea cinxia]
MKKIFLWTPYADKIPLDLSVKNKNVSNISHLPEMVACLQYPSYATADDVQRINYYQLPSTSSQPAIVYPPMNSTVLSPSSSPDSSSTENFPHIMADVDALQNDPNFLIFERNALRAMSEKNGGTLLAHNPRMRRAVQTDQNVDDSYRKQRERNNFAAKQSRDKRKLREIRLALKVTYLSNEVSRLKEFIHSKKCPHCRK